MANFGQGGPAGTLGCRSTAFFRRRYLANEVPQNWLSALLLSFVFGIPYSVLRRCLYPKIKWKNQSLSLILKWFFPNARKWGCHGLLSSVETNAESNSKSENDPSARRPNDGTFVGRHRNKEIFNSLQMKFKLNIGEKPPAREYYRP